MSDEGGFLSGLCTILLFRIKRGLNLLVVIFGNCWKGFKLSIAAILSPWKILILSNKSAFLFLYNTPLYASVNNVWNFASNNHDYIIYFKLFYLTFNWEDQAEKIGHTKLGYIYRYTHTGLIRMEKQIETYHILWCIWYTLGVNEAQLYCLLCCVTKKAAYTFFNKS